MANSQNGWPVDRSGSKQDRRPLIRDITVPNGVLAGDVAVVFRWLAQQYDRRVERLKPGWCWGWFVKNIEGSGTISNHASGTAVDFNAPDNPMGPGTTRKSMTQDQIDECHKIERESGGVLRWGGDFSRNDPMHWEIDRGPAAVKTFADQIRRQEENQVTTPTQTWTHDIDPTAGTYSAGGALWTIMGRTGALNTLPTAVADLRAALDAAVAADDVDFDALGASLVMVNQQLAMLTEDPAGMTDPEQHPIVAAVRWAMANPAPAE